MFVFKMFILVIVYKMVIGLFLFYFVLYMKILVINIFKLVEFVYFRKGIVYMVGFFGVDVKGYIWEYLIFLGFLSVY